MNKFYITTAIPYVNAAPHIGHALEFIQGDVIARYHRLTHDQTLLLSGGDENALKNVQAAEKAGVPIQQFVDQNTQLFAQLAHLLNVQFDIFQKGSDQKHHFVATQKLWERCANSGDIYKKTYKGLYCLGCEAFYTPEELDENCECFEHPGKKLEEVEEENYFFRLSKYQDQLIKLVESDEYKIIPLSRKNEVLAFLKQPSQDLSISRTNERARNWGVPVPGDLTQRVYVWFDALNIYQSGIGFGWDEESYQKWWPADLHVIGKGIIRFHAIYWPAFLLSAGLPLPKALLVHEYITINGQKMSKTVGNVLDPVPLVQKYGADPLRYYLLAKLSPFADGDFSEDKFIEANNADLANGLGNLVSRLSKLAAEVNLEVEAPQAKFYPAVEEKLKDYKFNEALAYIWSKIAEVNKEINERKPWELPKAERGQLLLDLITKTSEIAYNLQPFLPESTEKILQQFKGPIQPAEPLFPRI